MRDPLVYLGNKLMKLWEKFATVLLPPNSRRYQLSDCRSFLTNSDPVLREFSRNHGYFAVKKPLVGKVTRSKKDAEKTLALLEHVYDAFHDAPSCELISAEILTKVLAFRNLWEGLEVRIPMRSGDSWEFPLYRLDKVFNLWKNIPAFGFAPVEAGSAPPLLLFRGTQFSPFLKSGRASIMADLDPKGPGRSLFEFARPEIESWLQKMTSQGKARVMGYSLGGALAAYSLILMPKYFTGENALPSFLFHTPGITPDLCDEWLSLSESDRPAFETYISHGDLVSKIGVLFGATTQIKGPKAMPLISAHTTLLLAQKVCYFNSVDNEKENLSFYRNHYTMMHKSTSELFFKLGFRHFFPHPLTK